MFQFLKEIKEAVKEGLKEAEEEVAAENAAQEQEYLRLCEKEVPDLENMAIALSCPFREVLSEGSFLRLFQFGKMKETEKKSFQKLLYRDFEIHDQESLDLGLEKMNYLVESNPESNAVFQAAMHLYMITSAVDLGFISFADYEEECKRWIREIVKDENIASWEDFAKEFMDGECVNNALGKKLLRKSIEKLLREKESPWLVFPWESMQTAFTQEKELPMRLLENIVWSFSKEKMEDAVEFNKKVQEYQNKISKIDKHWKPEEMILERRKVFVQYEAWVRGKEDLLENEELVEDEEFLEEDAEDGYFQVEIAALLEADNGSSFTMSELLMKLHNQQCNKKLGDHVYFEGLEERGEYKKTPLYLLYCGS